MKENTISFELLSGFDEVQVINLHDMMGDGQPSIGEPQTFKSLIDDIKDTYGDEDGWDNFETLEVGGLIVSIGEDGGDARLVVTIKDGKVCVVTK